MHKLYRIRLDARFEPGPMDCEHFFQLTEQRAKLTKFETSNEKSFSLCISKESTSHNVGVPLRLMLFERLNP